MHGFLIVINGYEGIEQILGLCSTLEEALKRRENLQKVCAATSAAIKRMDAMTEEERDKEYQYLGLQHLVYVDPDQVCVREIVDDGKECTTKCVSACISYKFIG